MPKHFVRISGLKEGEHRQSFDIKDKFFEAYEKSEVKEGDFIVSTILKIKGVDRRITINIEGLIKNLLCDYCVEQLSYSISTTQDFVIKETEKKVDSSDDIIYVLPKQHQLNINQLIFEMISFSFPTKKFHQENGKTACDEKMLLLIEKYATKRKPDVDPRWQVLKKLK